MTTKPSRRIPSLNLCSAVRRPGAPLFRLRLAVGVRELQGEPEPHVDQVEDGLVVEQPAVRGIRDHHSVVDERVVKVVAQRSREKDRPVSSAHYEDRKLALELVVCAYRLGIDRVYGCRHISPIYADKSKVVRCAWLHRGQDGVLGDELLGDAPRVAVSFPEILFWPNWRSLLRPSRNTQSG
eukprot:XP_001706265.1 Hypothetical protein GL50803_19076 [Giardia lamblia ATCC 50803]